MEASDDPHASLDATVPRSDSRPKPERVPKDLDAPGPAWGVIRTIRLQKSATPWPAELEGDFLTVTDPEFGQPEAQELSLQRREAILSRIALVCRAVEEAMTPSLEEGLAYKLRPCGERVSLDARVELRLQAEARRVREAEAAASAATRREQCRPAIDALGMG